MSEMIATAREAKLASGGNGAIDVLYSYQERDTLLSPTDADRHREAFVQLEKAGVTHLNVTSQTLSTPATLDFVEAFGSIYLL
jgi:hypothetical protein